MTLTIGELFAGYGGLGLGVQAALGGEVAWVSEIDKGALKILGHRFPKVPNIGDVTTVDWATVPKVDVLTGGSPCQDLSHAGKRAGMTDGTRSNLWVAMREAIAQLRPGLVIWENVRGAYSAAADSDLEHCPGCMGDGRPGTVLRALGRVLGDLSDLGYVGGWHGLRAADVGSPHGRFRVFVVATLPEGVRLQAREQSIRGTTARSLTGGDLLPTPTTQDGANTGGASQFDRNTLPLNAAVTLLPTPAALDGIKAPKRYAGGNPSLPGAVSLLSPPAVALGDGGQTSRSGARSSELLLGGIVQDQDRWGDYAPAVARWEQIVGRPVPAPTMTSAKGNPQLSPAFVEWMMGLPPGWVTDAPGITRNEALKALGNGVVPQQAEAAVRWLLPRLP